MQLSTLKCMRLSEMGGGGKTVAKVLKRIGIITAFLVVAFLVYTGFDIKRAIDRVLVLEELGVAHLMVFQAVEEFTQTTGRFPESFEELASFEFSLDWTNHDWIKEALYYEELVEPVFAGEMSANSLNQFSPHFDTLPPWAQGNCRASWELILENCTVIDEP